MLGICAGSLLAPVMLLNMKAELLLHGAQMPLLKKRLLPASLSSVLPKAVEQEQDGVLRSVPGGPAYREARSIASLETRCNDIRITDGELWGELWPQVQ